ncbi:uncharacterized protein LY79DRAFT_568838 [Colletotrichum navitas]|uniref:Uncharacterized protein n=1 Tax=Colletotrichum navitas TaxID=681940 RepID=A0AAD8PPH0_9PEZI|nr:uncharacterized protein LY79DRAFT_568838 [Colletotrichum navitas]KAK1573323.1 hypothetical protein LY79DRAFT_568838 [Colletotrichum navitas]
MSSHLLPLDIVGSYVISLEYSSGDLLPGSLIAGCARIARHHVNEIRNSKSEILVAPQHQQRHLL